MIEVHPSLFVVSQDDEAAHPRAGGLVCGPCL